MRLIDADELMLRLENVNRVIGKSNLMDIIAKAETIEEQEEETEGEPTFMYYLCDRRACVVCDPECNLTTDITHAENWRRDSEGDWVEVEKNHFVACHHPLL